MTCYDSWMFRFLMLLYRSQVVSANSRMLPSIHVRDFNAWARSCTSIRFSFGVALFCIIHVGLPTVIYIPNSPCVGDLLNNLCLLWMRVDKWWPRRVWVHCFVSHRIPCAHHIGVLQQQYWSLSFFCRIILLLLYGGIPPLWASLRLGDMIYQSHLIGDFMWYLHTPSWLPTFAFRCVPWQLVIIVTHFDVRRVLRCSRDPLD